MAVVVSRASRRSLTLWAVLLAPDVSSWSHMTSACLMLSDIDTHFHSSMGLAKEKTSYQGKKNVYQYQSPPFSQNAMQWEKWPVRMNLPFFAVEAYIRGGGGSRTRPGKKYQKMAGTSTKIYWGWGLASGGRLLGTPILHWINFSLWGRVFHIPSACVSVCVWKKDRER